MFLLMHFYNEPYYYLTEIAEAPFKKDLTMRNCRNPKRH